MYCDKPKIRNYYRYYDTPDGCDIAKKVGVTTRYGVTTGLILGTYDVLMYSHVVGYRQMIRRYAKHVLPLGLMGATFAVVANGMVRLRQKDDPLNYFFGGFACGPILALYLGSSHAILLGGLALGVIGMIKKHAIETGTEFFPDYPSHMNTIRDWRSDYTMVKDSRDGSSMRRYSKKKMTGCTPGVPAEVKTLEKLKY